MDGAAALILRGNLPERLVCAVSPDWADRHRPVLEASGIVVRFVADGAALASFLANNWDVEMVVLDLALASPELAGGLGANGPRLLAFGDPAYAGLALQANLADFIADGASDDQLLAAIAAAFLPGPEYGVAELSDRSAARLGASNAEAERIAAAVARLNASGSNPARAPGSVSAASIRALIRARRARDRFFPGEIFGDPAWDMLLDLTAAHLEQRQVSVSSLCIAAAVPATTALRWIRNLCDAGLFVRHNDPDDARRAFIALPPPVAGAMFDYLAAIGETSVV